MPEVDARGTPPFQIEPDPWAVDIAARLNARFGDDVVLTVGAFNFPSTTRRRHDGAVPDPPAPGTEPSLNPDEVKISLAQPVEVESGRDTWSALRVTNHGSAPLVIRTNGHVTRVVDKRTGAIVGGYTGGQKLPLVMFRANPGETQLVPLLIGTGSYDPSLYAVPPGDWGIEVVLDLDERGKCRTPLLELRVLERA